MGNRIDTRVVLGSLRYKSAPDTNLMFNVPLIQTNKELLNRIEALEAKIK